MGKIKKLISSIPEKKGKLIGILGIICFGLLAIMSFCLATPVAKYVMFIEPTIDPDTTLSNFINPFNDTLLVLSIIGLLMSAAYFILRNDKRNKFYISNYVGSGIICAFSLFSAIYLILNISSYQSRFNTLDVELINSYFQRYSIEGTFTGHSSIFLLGYLLAGLILIYVGFVAYYTISKFLQDKKEGNIEYTNAESEVSEVAK